MKSIETLMVFRRGGGLAGSILGVLAGVVVVPILLLTPWGALLLALPAFVLVRGLLKRELSLEVVGLWSGIVAVGAVGVIAWASRTAPMDRHVSPALPSTHLALDELDRRIGWGDDDVPQLTVDLPSRQPTWNEINAALAPLGFKLNIAFCGNCDGPLWVHIVRSG
jgi:hypothetical protein